MAAQRVAIIATSGSYSASKYGEPKAPLAESTEDLPQPSLRRPEKTNATPPLFTASPEIRLNFFLKLPKKVIAALPAAPTPLKRLRRLPSPPWVLQNGPKPADRKHGRLRLIETETIGKGRSRARPENDFVCPPHMVGVRGQRHRGQD